MKTTLKEIRKIIREEIDNLVKKKNIREEYIETMRDFDFSDIVDTYKDWEESSMENYSEYENSDDEESGWNTRDAKIEILEELLDQLNKISANEDKIIIK